MNSSTPASWNSLMRSTTVSRLPTRPASVPPFDPHPAGAGEHPVHLGLGIGAARDLGSGLGVHQRLQMREFSVGFLVGVAHDHEGGQSEPQRRGAAGTRSQVVDHFFGVGERSAVDEEHVASVGRERAGRLGLPADVDRGQFLRHGSGQRKLACPIRERNVFPRPQIQHLLQPLPGVGVPVVVFGRLQAERFQLGQEPPADHVDRQSARGDLVDVRREFGEHQRVEQQRLDGSDQLDPRGGFGQTCQRRPGFEYVVLGVAGMDDVLRDESRVVPGPLRAQNQVPVAAVTGVGCVVGMQARAVVPVDRCPHPESWCRHDRDR